MGTETISARPIPASRVVALDHRPRFRLRTKHWVIVTMMGPIDIRLGVAFKHRGISYVDEAGEMHARTVESFHLMFEPV